MGETIGLVGVTLDGQDVYWGEARPTEGGRIVVVRGRPDGQTEDLTPAPINVRTRVHEYGGGAFTLFQGVLYYVNYGDQHLYRRTPDGAVRRLSQIDGMRYTEMIIDAAHGRVIAVREDHTVGDREAVAAIVSMALEGGDERVLIEGNDFYSSPRLSPDGTRLAWLTWNHPNMPWDGTAVGARPAGWRDTGKPTTRRGRPAGIDLPARVVADGRPPLHFGPHRLVEPLSSA